MFNETVEKLELKECHSGRSEESPLNQRDSSVAEFIHMDSLRMTIWLFQRVLNAYINQFVPSKRQILDFTTNSHPGFERKNQMAV
jgi:hypothetical protein